MNWAGNGNSWVSTANRLPPEMVTLDTVSPGGEGQQLIFSDGLWWHPDKSMYVYYVPKLWRIAVEYYNG